MKNYKQILILTAVLFNYSISLSQISTELLFEDNFTGTTLDSNKWFLETSRHTDEVQCYTSRPENLKVRNNNLEIIALRENYTQTNPQGVVTNYEFTSSSIETTSAINNLGYGKYEARIKVPTGVGFFPAFWTIGAFNGLGWPSYGEIDIMEFLGTENFVRGTAHWRNIAGEDGRAPRASSPALDMSIYHTYSVIRLPESITWYVDGTAYGTLNIWNNNDSTDELHTNHRIKLNLALGGWPPSPDATTPFPGTMFVDYVRVYKYDAALATNEVKNDNSRIIVSVKDNICSVKLTKSLSDFELTFYDMSGKKMLNKKVYNTNETSIDISTLSKGTYILNVTSTESERYSGMFINH
ncbi:family 16 glycosylhydrolase [Flavobacterium sp.]|uniref:glycoside hydrolase family 16 protein n=1 Tax=Flavobacterium sp. TaxID=239 RepID=UPI00286E8F8C|nr:family 16 glycosylhydrolase [Flavobacterium sp.]